MDMIEPLEKPLMESLEKYMGATDLMAQVENFREHMTLQGV